VANTALKLSDHSAAGADDPQIAPERTTGAGPIFARLPIAAILDVALSDGDRTVLSGICAYMRSDNWAWPSQTLLGIATGRSRSAVNRSIKRLEQRGHIDVHRNRYRDGSLRCSYRVNFTPRHLPHLPKWTTG
jgi:Helix-turn-helix domain